MFFVVQLVLVLTLQAILIKLLIWCRVLLLLEIRGITVTLETLITNIIAVHAIWKDITS